jgi:hypothetical protein
MMSRPGGGHSHNPRSHNLWPHQENQGRHGRCGSRYRDLTPLLLGSGVTSGTNHWEKPRSWTSKDESFCPKVKLVSYLIFPFQNLIYFSWCMFEFSIFAFAC